MKYLMRAAAAALLLPLASCGGDPLAERDPEGYKACTLLLQSRSEDAKKKMGSLSLAGDAAAKSTTPSIRASTSELLAGIQMADAEKLEKACADEGVDMSKARPASTDK